MNEWSDKKGKELNNVVLPPEKIATRSDNQDIDEEQVHRQGVLNDFCENAQIQIKWADANSANDDLD